MKIKCILGIGIACSAPAHSAVTAFLRPNPVIILIQGLDTDAKRIFEALDVTPTQVPSSPLLEKAVKSPSGQIEVSCRYSPSIESASCTFKIKRDSNFEVSDERKRAFLETYTNEDTTFLFNVLAKNDEGKVPMYVSEKQDFAFSSSMDRFFLSYQRIPNP